MCRRGGGGEPVAGLAVQHPHQARGSQLHLTIPPLTLLTRIGGIIGVGKEFLWIIITALTYFVTFSSKILKLT